MRARVAFASLVLLTIPLGGPARGADEPAVPLPPPLRVCDGHEPRLSPSGARLLVLRWDLDRDVRDANGQPERAPFAWVRDLATGREVRSPRSGRPVALDGEDVLVYDDGTGVRLPAGEKAAGYATRPKGVPFLFEAWSRDGRRYAYVPRAVTLKDHETPGPGREWGIHLVEAGAAPRHLPSPTQIEPGSDGCLVFSPDGRRLFFRATFFRDGDLPVGRTGLLDLSTGEYRFLGEGRGGGPSRWTPHGDGLPFDASGEHVAYLLGNTDLETDVWAADAGGKAVRRTADGGSAWGAALSPDGERVAYWREEGDAGGADGPRTALRVVALRADVALDVLLATPHGEAGDLLWLPGSSAFLYARDGAIWRQDLSPLAPPPPGAPILERSRRRAEEVVAALRSGDRQREQWALWEMEVHGAWDPAYARPLRDLLARAATEPVYHAMSVVQVLAKYDVVEAVPELVGVLRHPEHYVRQFALEALLRWDARVAEPAIRALREDAPWPETRPYIDAVLARFGSDAAWGGLAKACEDPVDDVREAAVDALGDLRDPRAVDLLIARLPDAGHYMEAPKMDIGDLAAQRLRRLTGQDFGRDAAAWARWWAEAGRRLPGAPAKAAPKPDAREPGGGR